MPPTNIERYIRSVFIQNIPAGITEDLFRQMLSQFGTLIHFHMFLDSSVTNNANEPNHQATRGYAFAEVKFNKKKTQQNVKVSSNAFAKGARW
mgnify:CR=1 FL=1